MKLLMFGAPWCQACKECKPYAMEAAEEGNCEFEYIDTDIDYESAMKYSVRTAPTFVAENGEKREYLYNRQEKEEILELIRSVM